MGTIDIEAYLERVGYGGALAPRFALLSALQRHHTAAISFENLDPLLRKPVDLDLLSLEKKLVRDGRGGYCFEQNGLFFHVLSALGFGVTPLAARVRWMAPADAPQSPLSHMMLMVSLEEGEFICDVGFGGLSPTAPLRLEPDLEQETPHGVYRLRVHGSGYQVETRLPDGWAAMYRFSREPQAALDYEMFNWYTATHPTSRFVNNLLAARVTEEGRLNLFNDELTLQRTSGERERRLLRGPDEAHEVLTRDFKIRIGRAETDNVWHRLPKQAQTDM